MRNGLSVHTVTAKVAPAEVRAGRIAPEYFAYRPDADPMEVGSGGGSMSHGCSRLGQSSQAAVPAPYAHGCHHAAG